MNITIVPADKAVKVGNVRKKLMDFDWSPFEAIHAVQATIDRDRATIEFREIDPDGDGPLPSYKPANELIGAAEFAERFGGIIAAFDAAPEPARKSFEETFREVRDNPNATTLREDQLPILDQRLSALEAKFNILFEEVSKARGQS